LAPHHLWVLEKLTTYIPRGEWAIEASISRNERWLNALRNLTTATPGEAEQIGPDTASEPDDTRGGPIVSDRGPKWACLRAFHNIAVGLGYSDNVAGAPGRVASISVMMWIALRDGWEGDKLDTSKAVAMARRVMSLASLLPEEEHVAVVQRIFVSSIRQLLKELTTC